MGCPHPRLALRAGAFPSPKGRGMQRGRVAWSALDGGRVGVAWSALDGEARSRRAAPMVRRLWRTAGFQPGA